MGFQFGAKGGALVYSNWRVKALISVEVRAVSPPLRINHTTLIQQQPQLCQSLKTSWCGYVLTGGFCNGESQQDPLESSLCTSTPGTEYLTSWLSFLIECFSPFKQILSISLCQKKFSIFDTILTTFEAEKVCILLVTCHYVLIFRMNSNYSFQELTHWSLWGRRSVFAMQ
jgi:hypothetical protein